MTDIYTKISQEANFYSNAQPAEDQNPNITEANNDFNQHDHKNDNVKGLCETTNRHKQTESLIYSEHHEVAALKIQKRYRKYVRTREFQKAYVKIYRLHKQRSTVVKEILTTEKSYSSSLLALLQFYMYPLLKAVEEDKPIISRESIKAIFSEAETIYRLAEVFEQQLNERIQKWGPYQKIADIFLQMSSYLLAYSDYVNNYNNAVYLFTKLAKKNKEFAEFLATAKETANGLDLCSYLIMPIQRIPRYTLLIEQVIKFTWDDHSDYLALQDAHAKLKHIANTINEKIRESEHVNAVLEIQNRIANLPKSLVKPGRRFIKDGHFIVFKGESQRPREVFLFNDILVWCKQKMFKDLEFEQVNYVEDLTASNPEEFLGKPVFTIVSLTSAAVVVGVNTPEERAQWMQLLNEPVTNAVILNRTRSFYGIKAMEKSDSLNSKQKKGGTFKRITNTLRSRKKYSFDAPEEEHEEKESPSTPERPSTPEITGPSDDSLWKKFTATGRNSRTISTDKDELSRAFAAFKLEGTTLTVSAPTPDSPAVIEDDRSKKRMSLELQAQPKLKSQEETDKEDDSGFFKKLQIPFAKRDKRSISPSPSAERRVDSKAESKSSTKPQEQLQISGPMTFHISPPTPTSPNLAPKPVVPKRRTVDVTIAPSVSPSAEATVSPTPSPIRESKETQSPQPVKNILDNAPTASNYEWRSVRASMAITRNEIATYSKDATPRLRREGSDKILSSPRNREEPIKETKPRPPPPSPKPPPPRSVSAPVEDNRLSDETTEKRKSVKEAIDAFNSLAKESQPAKPVVPIRRTPSLNDKNLN